MKAPNKEDDRFWGPVLKEWKNDGALSRSGRCWRGDVYWREMTLHEAAKNLIPFDLPLAGIPMGYNPWELSTIDEIAYHVQRVNDADFSHPIILDDFGNVRDGYHRVVKALILGNKTIKAVRLLEMPEIDGKKEE